MSIDFSHLQSDGTPGMVDVSSKNETVREAKAQSIVFLGAEIVQHFEAAGWQNKKGEHPANSGYRWDDGGEKDLRFDSFMPPFGIRFLQI